MDLKNISRLCIIGMLAGSMSTLAGAAGFSMGNSKPSANDNRTTTNRPWGNIGATKAAPQYQPLQPPPASLYPGTENVWYSARLPASSAVTSSQPTVEVDVAGSVFYERQNLVYTVRVVSDENLQSLTPLLPNIEGAVLALLDGPVPSARTRGPGSRRQIINTYRYKLMPIRPGELVIPAIRFEGTHASSSQRLRDPRAPAAMGGRSFSIAADKPLTLQVRPADAAVKPWLPLHDLKIQANLSQNGPVKAGEPVTLQIDLQAKGALGNQLPSLGQQLESRHYRIYRDATDIKNGISSNGRYLTGSRKETYTIVPVEDGWVRLPEVNLAWWDVDSQSPRIAGMPFGHADSAAGSRLAAGQGDGQGALYSILFWIPMIVAMSLIAGIWLGSWQYSRKLIRSAATRASAGGRHVRQFASRVGAALTPTTYTRRLRLGLALLMPRSVKVWMCARCVRTESDPEAWCADFRSRVCSHLDVKPDAPLTHVAEQLIKANPQAEPGRLRALSLSLERAIYGGTSLDFPAWKREFMQQLRPRLLPGMKGRSTKTLLPALNPHTI